MLGHRLHGFRKLGEHEMKTRLIHILAFTLGFIARKEACAERLEKIGEEKLINAPVGRLPDGRVIVPTNQVIDPAGAQIEFSGRAVDLWLAPDQKTLGVTVEGQINLMDVEKKASFSFVEVGAESAYHGLAASADGKHIYVSNPQRGVAVIEMESPTKGKFVKRIEMPKKEGDDRGPVPTGLALTEDEKRLCVCVSRLNMLALMDLATDKIVAQIPVGVAPYGVLVKGSRAFVSDWAGRQPKPGDLTAETSGSQMVINKKFAAASGTISVVDLEKKTEIASIEVELHPSGMTFNKSKSRLFVANANSDTVSVVDTNELKVVETISVRPKDALPFGSAPNTVEVSPDGATLYVANGANNSLAVIELGRPARGDELKDAKIPDASRIKGFIPTGWYPASVKIDPAGKTLFVANIKGVGSLSPPYLPNGGFVVRGNQRGSVSIIPVPNDEELAKLTARVEANNRTAWSLMGLERAAQGPGSQPVPIPLLAGEKSVFKHVIYIIKENRSYDQLFGDIKKGNGKPELCMFGEKITPNHHALADQFTLFDNFYCNGIMSADGHHWATEAYATDYLEKSLTMGWPRSFPMGADDMLANSAGGFIWDAVLAKGLTFRDYGEMVASNPETTGIPFTFVGIYQDFAKGGNHIRFTGFAHVKTLEPYICQNYCGYSGTVPDVVRAAAFIKELKEFEEKGGFPNFMLMHLPNDHTVGSLPGEPTPSAALADNDLALGRIVEAVSHSKFWPETCIFVTEDDPSDGADHVDGHRTIGLVASPYTKRGFVDSTNYTQVGMIRTMEWILDVPPMNQLDLASTPMIRCFQDKPDLTPYDARPNNVPLDDLNPKLTALRGKQRYWAEQSLKQDFSEPDKADEWTINRIIWHSVKGYDVPYPEISTAKQERDDDHDDKR